MPRRGLLLYSRCQNLSCCGINTSIFKQLEILCRSYQVVSDGFSITVEQQMFQLLEGNSFDAELIASIVELVDRNADRDVAEMLRHQKNTNDNHKT